MNILECKALTKRYGSRSALEGVELSIEPGRIVGLLGPNGSGKTTLIKLANGLLTPTSGEIRIDGKAPSPETKAIVSYLPIFNCQIPYTVKVGDANSYGMSVMELEQANPASLAYLELAKEVLANA